MEAIRALQQQLMEAQRASNARKISERNCIDLVQKLIQTGQVKLFHTSNGKEYLTPEQLDNEIRDCLEACGGRISVTELPNEMGIGMEHLEARVEVLRKRDSSLHKLNNDLFSQQYLQQLAQDVEESLEESGSLQVADLASRYNLPSEYIRNSVLVLLSSQAVVRQNTVHTSSYAARFEARVRGCLRGCLQPVILSQLATRHGFDPDLLNSTVQKMIREEVILGKFQGGAFTPKAYTDAEAKKIDSFFESNGFLTAAMAKTCNLTLKEWVAQRKVEGHTLLSAFVSKHVAEEVQAAVAEALAAGAWIDVQPLLPPSLPASDAAELLLQLSNQFPSAVLLEHVAVSGSFVQGIAAALEGEVQQAAEKSMKPRAKKDDEEMDSKKRKAKGKSQKKKGDDEDSAVRTGGTSESGVSNEAILNHLEDQHPDLPEMALPELCVEVQRHLTQMVAEAAEKLRSSLQTKQKQQFEQADKLVQERYEKLVLGLRGLRALEASHEKQESPLYQHLLREVVLEPLHALIALRLEEATGQSVEVTAANRKQCLEKLAAAEKNPPEVLQRLVAAMAKKDTKETKDSKESKDPKEGKEGKEKGKSKKGDAAKDADDADISELYHAAADDSHIFCRKVDKKREKAAAQEQQRALKERLKEATPSDALAMCHLGLQLALAAEGVSCLVLPCELWALRLAAIFFHSEVSKSPEVGEQCLHLCDLCDEKGDAVEREAAAAAWRERFL